MSTAKKAVKKAAPKKAVKKSAVAKVIKASGREGLGSISFPFNGKLVTPATILAMADRGVRITIPRGGMAHVIGRDGELPVNMMELIRSKEEKAYISGVDAGKNEHRQMAVNACQPTPEEAARRILINLGGYDPTTRNKIIGMVISGAAGLLTQAVDQHQDEFNRTEEKLIAAKGDLDDLQKIITGQLEIR